MCNKCHRTRQFFKYALSKWPRRVGCEGKRMMYHNFVVSKFNYKFVLKIPANCGILEKWKLLLLFLPENKRYRYINACLKLFTYNTYTVYSNVVFKYFVCAMIMLLVLTMDVKHLLTSINTTPKRDLYTLTAHAR